MFTEVTDTISKYYVCFNQGINLRKMGKYEASIDKLNQAQEFCNLKASLYNNIGLS
jgi:hypothetical protein